MFAIALSLLAAASWGGADFIGGIVSKRLAVGWGNHPDYWETYKPKLDGTFSPTVQNDKRPIPNSPCTPPPWPPSFK